MKSTRIAWVDPMKSTRIAGGIKELTTPSWFKAFDFQKLKICIITARDKIGVLHTKIPFKVVW
jgi:hypothetical protein